MAGSTIGTIFRVTTWGESHGKALGAVIDGCPAGLELSESDIQPYLDRRKPGQSKFTTARTEGDEVEILSGVFEGKTTGCPISLIIRNKDQHSGDYSNIANTYRPGHADYTYQEKYGIRDYRGGGRSSGRETVARVAAGAVATKLLNQMGIEFLTYTKSIGPVEISKVDPTEINNNKLYMPDEVAAIAAEEYVTACISNQESCGGVVCCEVSGLPVGLGDPAFEKLNANLAKAICSIGAVKAFEIGDGIAVAKAVGSENNDNFRMQDGEIVKLTNHAGGILGGISDGSTLVLRATIKPTPSISQSQETVSLDGEDMDLVIHGRHDPIIVPRAVVVVEAMTAITLCDALLLNMSSRLDKIKDFYN